jgi:iron complex outermembrane receptor protein
MKSILTIILAAASITFSETFQLSGIVTESKNNSPLIGANVFINELNIGVATDDFGFYRFDALPEGTYNVVFSFIGYENLAKEITIKNEELLLNVKLKQSSVLLKETVVESAKAQFRKTPIAFAEFNPKDIEERLGARDIVYVLDSSPSVYISPQGGGTGDLRLNMRGFGQTNIAIMFNGIPQNNPENGEVYWTNWAGVSDFTSEIQVQRGLGANPYSVSAIGGVVNISTFGIGDGQNFRRIRTEFGSENFRKISFAFNEDILSSKIGITALISKKTWDGYADQTYLDEFSYYLSLGGVFGNHSLELQLMGSPQDHGQRLTLQTISFWKSHGKNFNSDWGYLNGKALNIRDNVFHKPSINLNHNWQIDEDLVLSNILYFSHGNGGGTVPSWTEFGRTTAGLADLDAEWEKNTNTILPDVDPELNYTDNALRFTVHKHNWFGLISNIRKSFNNFEISGGIDARYYSSENYRKVNNLLGGDYTLYSSNLNIDPFTKLFIGDKVDYNADSFVRQVGTFIQGEYQINNLTIYTNVSLSNTGYKRIDYFNYAPDHPMRETDWKDIVGYTLKHGYNFNIDKSNNIFFNAGYFSRAPLSENVYDFFNNEYENLTNEKIINFEGGYGLQSRSLILRLNGYYTTWKDKAIRTDVQDLVTGQRFFYNISGADARHIGIEFEGKAAITNTLSINTMFSHSINKWTSNVNAVVAPESNPLQQQTINSYVNDIYVGGYPMTTASVSIYYRNKLSNNGSFYFNPVYKFAGRHYAQYNPDQRSNILDDGVNPWRIPDYFLLDIHLGYEINLMDAMFDNLSIGLHVFNILNNTDYIVDAIDGADHSSQSAVVWFGRGRWWHASFTLDF